MSFVADSRVVRLGMRYFKDIAAGNFRGLSFTLLKGVASRRAVWVWFSVTESSSMASAC